jgi:hypothetical protein
MNIDDAKITEITKCVDSYINDITAYIEKNNKSASTRARNALSELAKLARAQRKVILESRKTE